MAEYIDRDDLIEWLKRIPLIDLSDGRGLCRLIMEDDFKKAIKKMPKGIIADIAPVRRGRWDDEHKCTVCRNEAFCKISNIQPDYDYDWEENLVETGGYIWDTEWLETTYCPHCGAKMDLEEPV